MNQDTEWDNRANPRRQETIFVDQKLPDLKAAEAAVAEEWKVGDVILDLYEVKGVLGEVGSEKFTAFATRFGT